MELTPFVDLINKNCGLQIESKHSPNLSEAIHARMTLKQLNSSKQYFDFLMNSSEEIQNLINLVTNNETYFFRERPHFQICMDQLVPSIIEKKRSKQLKIINAGCSSGEEPYSLAIALADKYGIDIFKTISIIGFDISESVLRTARKGEFGAHSFRETSSTYQEKYFQRIKQDQYKINSSIKGAVKFYRCNLSQPPYPEWLSDADIIFYRNVSIYFPQQIKKSVFKNLSKSLNDHGYIILSSTETFSHSLEGLSLEEIQNKFFYTKKGGFKNNLVKTASRTNIRKKIQSSESTKINNTVLAIPPSASIQKKDKNENPSKLFEKGLRYAIQKDYAKSFSSLESLLAIEPTHIEAQNLCATIHINLQQLEKAKDRCLNVVKLDEWNLEARLLSGIVARMEGNHKEATKWFKSVSFIQPSCWTAHMYLAELHDMDGDLKGAYREYSLALKHLEITGAEKRNLSYFPLAYSQEQLVHLFKHNLNNLEQKINFYKA